MPDELIIVSRSRPELYESLRSQFRDASGVDVVVDRRGGAPGASSTSTTAGERRRLSVSEALRATGFARVRRQAGDASTIRRVGPPKPSHVRGRIFTWTVPLTGMPPKPWRQFFVATRDRTLDCDPSRVSFYQAAMIFESEERLVPTWIRFIDGWMAAANERFAKDEDEQRRLRAWAAEEQRDAGDRLREAEERFKNL